MDELEEIRIEEEKIMSLPAWEWDEEMDDVLALLARRKLELLAKEVIK